MGKSYTGTGDDGTTGRFGGQRESKAALIPAAVGAVDEVNSLIGLALSGIGEKKSDTFGSLSAGDRGQAQDSLRSLQHVLFRVGADISTPADKEATIPRISPEDTQALEQRTDALDAALPELHAFILPGGTRTAATIHVARAVTRRAERALIAARESGEDLNEALFPFMNRLSSYLFALARWINWRAAAEETPPDYTKPIT